MSIKSHDFADTETRRHARQAECQFTNCQLIDFVSVSTLFNKTVSSAKGGPNVLYTKTNTVTLHAKCMFCCAIKHIIIFILRLGDETPDHYIS